MLAYIDASGNMGQQPVYVMAGYFAASSAWKAFSADWKKALDQPRKTSVIKMSHLMARDKTFAGWSEAERDAKLKILAPIINSYARGRINVVVPIASWRSHFVGKLDRVYHDRPYYFAVHSVMSSLAKYLYGKGINDPVQFIFDSEDAEPTEEIQRTYADFVRTAPPFLQNQLSGPPRFEKDEEAQPLQAADILAWHVRRAFVAKQKNVSKNFSVIAKPLFSGCESVQCNWTDSQLREAAEFIMSRRLWKSH